MKQSLKPCLVAALSVLVASSTEASVPHVALKPGEAAVVGGWAIDSSAVQGVVLQAVAQDGGCLRLVGPRFVLPDHQTVDSAVIAAARRIKPGRYAAVGVKWSAEYYYNYNWGGVSRQQGEAWIVNIEPGVVTDLGVWSITSPYLHRYILGSPDLTAGLSEARSAADGVGPLAMADWTHASIGAATPACAPGKPS